jgi:hypothetical protein
MIIYTELFERRETQILNEYLRIEEKKNTRMLGNENVFIVVMDKKVEKEKYKKMKLKD